eukprot:501715-Pyramimonas_sp.AAC.1
MSCSSSGAHRASSRSGGRFAEWSVPRCFRRLGAIPRRAPPVRDHPQRLHGGSSDGAVALADDVLGRVARGPAGKLLVGGRQLGLPSIQTGFPIAGLEVVDSSGGT